MLPSSVFFLKKMEKSYETGIYFLFGLINWAIRVFVAVVYLSSTQNKKTLNQGLLLAQRFFVFRAILFCPAIAV